MRPLDPAPEIPTGEWLHLSAAVDLRHDLAGRAAMLVFFASSCAHSEQALRIAAWMDARFAGRPLAVIGVASPRLPRDADVATVTARCADLGLALPIFLDRERALWDAYECVAWPTLVLVDGTGRVRYHGAGELDAGALGQAVKTLLAEVEFGGYGYSLPDMPRVPAAPAAPRAAGLAVDADAGLLWVADAARHRVCALDLVDGTLRAEVGAGRPGASDGAAGEATFYSPRAVGVAGGRIVVADTGNHLLRAIDRETLTVSTVAGTGARDTAGAAQAGALPAPSAVAADAEGCFVASALGHAIVRAAWDAAGIHVVAGSGMRGRADGPAAQAVLAQPAALARAGERLAFCDAGSHAVRILDLARQVVTTLVGGEGDAEGACDAARFRNPCALAFDGDDLLVADAGNDRVRRIDLGRSVVTTLLDASAGVVDPVALALDGRRLFVAVDGGRRLLACDLAAGTQAEWSLPSALAPTHPLVELALRAYSDCVVRFHLALSPGARVHPDASVRVRLTNVEGAALAVDLTYEAVVEGEFAVARGVTTGEPGRGTVAFAIAYYTKPGSGGDVAHPQAAAGQFVLVTNADAPTLAAWRAPA